MLQGVHSIDWLKYNASYDLADESFGFKKVGKNVRLHCLAIVPNPAQVEIGDNVRIDAGTIISAREVKIGSFVHIGAHCLLSGKERIEFHDFSSMSHGAKIFTSTDDLDFVALSGTTVPEDLQEIISKPVILENHAILGAGAIIMPGVTMEYASVAGALSLVKDNVRRYDIVGGVPAKFLKQRARVVDGMTWDELERRCYAADSSS